ncbi:MAG: elongation factor Ts [Ruminococcaceae bacterium]|nr:elongation factor Ts [Oscillospiraceae bacterium]
MAAITAKDVAELRKKTGCGMMECKKALVEANGDMDEAVKVLREKGLAAAGKKADRIAADGLVDTLTVGDVTAIIEVNTETDFVAKNESFREFVRGLLTTIVDKKPADVAALSACQYLDTDMDVNAKLNDMVFTIGEKLDIRRFDVVNGTTSTYIHGTGAIGVVVSFDADDAVKNNAGFAEFAKNIALQVAAYPVEYLNREAVPAARIAEEREIIMSQINNDEKNAKKPEQIKEKMVDGKIGKFYEANCLLDQAYVKDDGMSVQQYVDACAKEFGGAIAVTGFIRYEKGEGIQKREENFAEEINKMVNG